MKNKNYEYHNLNSVLHARIRLAIISLLYHDGKSNFNTLKAMIGATDGNLSTHLVKLEEVKYIAVKKQIVQKKTLTEYTLTEIGKKAFEEYVYELEKLIKKN